MEKVELISKDLETLVNSLKTAPNGISTGQAALIGACVGAMAAILAQVVIFFLTRWKEKDNLKKELISEERRISFAITELYKEYLGYLTIAQYWARIGEIDRLNGKDKDSKADFERHYKYDNNFRETKSKIRIFASEYLKKVIHFMTLNKKTNLIIQNALKAIEDFELRDCSEFKECFSEDTLFKAQAKEYKDLLAASQFLNGQYLIIHNEMKKIMNLK